MNTLAEISTAIKTGAVTAATSPKTGVATLAVAAVEKWWIEWGNAFIDACATIVGLIVFILLGVVYFQTIIKKRIEIKIGIRTLEELDAKKKLREGK